MNENETRKRNVTVKDKTNHKMEEKHVPGKSRDES